tara:strand:- start:921 stop:1082 length:162 start_codon:yes stop_codon:yes gene_type:complete
MDLLILIFICALVIENYGNLYKFLSGKSNNTPYYYQKKDTWNWQDDWDKDDIF